MMDRNEREVRDTARWDVTVERLVSLAEELDVPVQRAYVEGALPPWPVTVLVYTGASGLDAVDEPIPFSQRYEIRERQAIREMEDGALLASIGRLRRILVMADEDQIPDFLLDLYKRRFAFAERELRWRQQASDRGGPPVDRSRQWRDRVERVKERVDLGMLIAHECDGAKPTGPGKWQCCCPFHPDRDPSLSIDVEKGLWNCHGCHVGGDAFTYVELRYGLDFAAAVRHLEQRL